MGMRAVCRPVECQCSVKHCAERCVEWMLCDSLMVVHSRCHDRDPSVMVGPNGADFLRVCVAHIVTTGIHQ